MNRLARRTYVVAIALAALVALVHDASGQQTQTPPKTYAPGETQLDASRVYVFVGKSGFGHEHAVMGNLRSGYVRLDAPAKAGRLVFEMSSFDADPDQARKFLGLEGSTDPSTRKKVVANMTGVHVLDVAHFPTATYEIASTRKLPQLSKRGLPTYEFQGIFTLHGKSRPVTFPVEVEARNGWNRLMGQFSILQTDYGITPYSTALGAIGVADKLIIYGDVWIAADVAQAQAPRPTAQ